MGKTFKRSTNGVNWINTSEDWVLRTYKNKIGDEESDATIIEKVESDSPFTLGGFKVIIETETEEKPVTKKKTSKKKRAPRKKAAKKTKI